MKFIAALLIATSQAIKFNVHGDLPWNPPAVEKAQNVYHDAPANQDNQPPITDVVHSGRLESNIGSQIITSNPNSDINGPTNNSRAGPNNSTADTPKMTGVVVGTASVESLQFVNPAYEEKKEEKTEEKKGDAKDEKKEEKKVEAKEEKKEAK